MLKETFISTVALVSTALLPVSQAAGSLLSPVPDYLLVFNQNENVLAEETLDLTIREPNPDANQGYTDNILLALHYLKGDIKNPKINWDWVRQPFEVSFILQSGEVFAFHENVLAEYQNLQVTINSRFFIDEGYKSVWGLGGNGVCHLASLLNWVASEAGLEVMAKANHDFAPVPGVAREYGTSIRSQSPNQNLYLTNSLDYPVVFRFVADNQKVVLRISQLNKIVD